MCHREPALSPTHRSGSGLGQTPRATPLARVVRISSVNVSSDADPQLRRCAAALTRLQDTRLCVLRFLSMHAVTELRAAINGTYLRITLKALAPVRSQPGLIDPA